MALYECIHIYVYMYIYAYAFMQIFRIYEYIHRYIHADPYNAQKKTTKDGRRTDISD